MRVNATISWLSTDLCKTRFVLISTGLILATVLAIAIFNTNTSTLRVTQTVACSARGISLNHRQQFEDITIFGVASVYHQVLELARVLKNEGIKVTKVTSVETLNTSLNDTLYILLAPQLVISYPKHFIAYQVEQWGTPWITNPWGAVQGSDRPSSYRDVLAAALEVWDYSRWNIQHFEYPTTVKRCQVKYMPFAWFPTASCSALNDRDIDVLFFGAMNDKRQSKLLLLNELGVQVTHVSAQESELDTFICRSKIVLNLHYYDGLLETSRIMHAISLNALVISEPPIDPSNTYDFDPAVVFEDEVADIADSILSYLGDDAKRHRRVHMAYQYCKNKYALRTWLSDTYIAYMLN